MKLAAHVDDLEALDEEIRHLYVEDKDGGYRLDVEVEGFEDPNPKLQANNLKLLKELDNLRKKYKEIEPHYQELLEAHQKTEEDIARKKGDYDALVKQKDEAHGRETEKLRNELKTLESEIRTHLVDKAAMEAIAKAKGSVAVLLPHVKAACRCQRDDEGKWTVDILGPDGRPKLNAKGTAPMTIADFVEDLKSNDEFAVNFEGSGATGGGAVESLGGRGGGTVVLKKEDQADPTKYRAAKDRAEKEGLRLVLEN